MDTDGAIRSLSHLTKPLLSTAAEEPPPGNVGTLVFLFIVFVILGAYFGGAESGFSAMNRIRIKAKADDGDKRAKSALYISNNFDRALTTLLIGNNITHIAAASVATVIASRLFGASDRVTALCTVVTTLIVFLFSEMIPKSFANDRSETTAIFSAPSLKFLMKVLAPISAFFSWISSAFTRLVEHFVKPVDEPSITEEELYDIIDTIEEEGVMNEEQGDLFKSALDFSDTCAEDVMTMRDDIVAVDASLPNSEIFALVRETNHTRLPVYIGSIDRIIGILQIRVFLREYRKNPKVSLRSLLLPAYPVHPDAKIDELLTEMRQHRFYLGIVSDEAGKTLGLVTIEDFLEELVGEIWDEDDVVDKDFIKLGGNRFRVSARLTLGSVAERLSLDPPNGMAPDLPLLSLVLLHFGHMPEEDDSFLLDHWEFTVDTVENGQVNTVVIRLLSDEDLAELTVRDEKEEV